MRTGLQYKHKKRSQGNEGFTLIELMVSLTLFTVVVLAAVASLYTVNSASRKVQAMRTVLDNLNFAMESMSRTIRTGTEFRCNNGGFGAVCPLITQPDNASAGGSIALKGTLGTAGNIQYLLESDCDQDGTNRGCIEKKDGGASPIAITSPEINVQNLTFYVDGACTPTGVAPNGLDHCDPDTYQPSVTIFIQGTATAGGTVAPFAVQTLVSQRTAE